MIPIKFRNAWIVPAVAILSAGTASAAGPIYTGTYFDMYVKPNTFPAGLIEEKVYLDAAKSSTVTGHAGSQTNPRLVTFSSTTDVLDAANGFSTIKAVDGFLNNVTITAPGYWFADLIFSVNLAPNANNNLTITANSLVGADSYAGWTTLGAWVNGENRILVLAKSPNLMTSVTINSVFGMASLGGLNQLKQTEISGLTRLPAPVPEPETYVMLLAGLGLIGFVIRRKLH